MPLVEPTRLANNAKYGRASRPLNKFGRWCAEHGLVGTDVDKALGVGVNTSYRYIRPLDHQLFNVPPAPVMARIFALTGGAIEPNDFYDIDAWRAGLPEANAPQPEGLRP